MAFHVLRVRQPTRFEIRMAFRSEVTGRFYGIFPLSACCSIVTLTFAILTAEVLHGCNIATQFEDGIRVSICPFMRCGDLYLWSFDLEMVRRITFLLLLSSSLLLFVVESVRVRLMYSLTTSRSTDCETVCCCSFTIRQIPTFSSCWRRHHNSPMEFSSKSYCPVK